VRKIYIVISGGGKVGSFLGKRLLDKGHAVAIIEKDPAICESLSMDMNALVINGDACDLRFQEEAHVERADVFAAVTGDDDDNLVACQLAKVSFEIPRAVARVNNPKNEHIFNFMGIDAISSTTIIGELVERETTIGDIITLYTLQRGRLAMVELDIPEAGSAACGRELKDLGLPKGCVIVSIIRGDEAIVPHGGDVLQPGDSVIAIASVDQEGCLRDALVSR
jgi:trk/ktr system potassium uptake protein